MVTQEQLGSLTVREVVTALPFWVKALLAIGGVLQAFATVALALIVSSGWKVTSTDQQITELALTVAANHKTASQRIDSLRAVYSAHLTEEEQRYEFVADLLIGSARGNCLVWPTDIRSASGLPCRDLLDGVRVRP